jgi:hypothetical protein
MTFELLSIAPCLPTLNLGGISNVYAANQVVDTTKSPTTFIDTTANGVDLINIANPNSVGVSINHYNKFNVGNTLYFNPKKSHWGGKILILVLQIG